jgi:hypothetical protein
LILMFVQFHDCLGGQPLLHGCRDGRTTRSRTTGTRTSASASCAWDSVTHEDARTRRRRGSGGGWRCATWRWPPRTTGCPAHPAVHKAPAFFAFLDEVALESTFCTSCSALRHHGSGQVFRPVPCNGWFDAICAEAWPPCAWLDEERDRGRFGGVWSREKLVSSDTGRNTLSP